MKEFIKGANPYMPLWEHVPDGEPRVFEHNGEKRVYVYGSHDIERDKYCGRNYVVWSAPVEDLGNWMSHGIVYTAKQDPKQKQHLTYIRCCFCFYKSSRRK